jgi:endonuclease G, mitochondrial
MSTGEQAEPAASAEARRAASAIVERSESTGRYYNAEEDDRLRSDYYRGIDWTGDPKALAAALTRRLTSGHVSLSYRSARHDFLYPSIDLHKDGKLHAIYSDRPLDPVETIARELALLQPLTAAMRMEMTGAGFAALLDNDRLWDLIEANSPSPAFDCEHVVCQDWFGAEREQMKSDLHHLFACERSCNGFRDNIPYWQFPTEAEDAMADCGRREGRTKFEPKQGKGPAARATLYFLLRYPGQIGDEAGELTRERLPILLGWHRAHPLTRYELHRNWLIAKAQGNRNPFIDRPEAATAELLAGCFGGA